MRSNTAELSRELRHRIKESLAPLHPKKVIVYGSFARGEANHDSDIDLVVILDNGTMPQTYQERAANRLAVRQALDAVNRDHAMDVFVYAVPEWKRFQDLDSAFSREILSQGVEL